MMNPDRADSAEPIYVTRPYLPPLEEFVDSLREIWDSRVLTNEGPFHKKFEAALAEYLGVEHVSLFTNGTLALVTALQTLRITGEVITTPFSFVATTHALHWNGITPVFCDIEPDTFNLDPERIEAAITPKTTAILPVHIYGNPCNVARIREIGETYGLRVIYDAAHTFGARLDNRSLADFGDLSVLSFHATKVFTTFEGGAIVSHDAKTARRIYFLKNFGFADEVTVVGPGINAKMTEFQAALGLAQLGHVADAIEARRRIAAQYRALLRDVPGVRCLDDLPEVQHNYAYFPVLIDQNALGRSRDEVYEALKQNGILARRYFYPPISHFPTYRGLPSAAPRNLPVTEEITKQILCLPIYPGLDPANVERIVGIVAGGG